MSRGGFGSLIMAASVAGAALGCYLVSLNVASERAELESVEADIVKTQREIRVLQTEIGTRGRLAQLERWNVNFIRLSAPSADQILEGSFQLASMVRPPAKPALDAPIVLASAPAPERAKADGTRPDQLMQVASYTVPLQSERPTVKPAAPTPTEAGRVEPKKAGPKKAEANKAEAKKVEPARADPVKAAPPKLAKAKPTVVRPKPQPGSDPLAPLATTSAAPAEDTEPAQ